MIRLAQNPKTRQAAATRATADRARLRSLVHDGALAACRADRAIARDAATDPAWVHRRLDEAIDALTRARNRAVLLRADVTVAAVLDA